MHFPFVVDNVHVVPFDRLFIHTQCECTSRTQHKIEENRRWMINRNTQMHIKILNDAVLQRQQVLSRFFSVRSVLPYRPCVVFLVKRFSFSPCSSCYRRHFLAFDAFVFVWLYPCASCVSVNRTTRFFFFFVCTSLCSARRCCNNDALFRAPRSKLKAFDDALFEPTTH